MECFAYALKLLNRRGYFEAEIRASLQEGYTDQQIEDAVNELKEFNYINDARLLGNFIQWQLEKGHGERYILQALNKKGVRCSTDDIRSVASQDERLSVIRKYAEKYLRRHKRGARTDVSRLNGCFRYLASRGFLQEDIATILNEIKKENI
ncbi:MAG: recombination regulator RecX [Deferribacteraceae bacterium]|nr:recombination regulator RecX [Deferribacteraceae bacterium]